MRLNKLDCIYEGEWRGGWKFFQRKRKRNENNSTICSNTNPSNIPWMVVVLVTSNSFILHNESVFSNSLRLKIKFCKTMVFCMDCSEICMEYVHWNPLEYQTLLLLLHFHLVTKAFPLFCIIGFPTFCFCSLHLLSFYSNNNVILTKSFLLTKY